VPEKRGHFQPERLSGRRAEAPSNGRQAVERDTAELLYRHGIGSVLVSLLASSGLAFISSGQVSSKLLLPWWILMSLVLAMRGIDILHFHRFRSAHFRSGVREILRFGVGVVATAALWAAFPIVMLRDLTQTGRACTAIVLCGMVGGGATVLAPSKTLSLIFCVLLVLPTSTLFLFLPGAQNTFLGVLGWAFFAVMLISSRVTNRATMTALRLSRANEALIGEMEDERRRTEAANIELQTAQVALSEANRSLEHRVQLRTADLQKEMSERERYAKELAYLASTDPLTGLRNRSSLRESLSLALACAERAGESLAVLFLDLDKFKEVNDVLGHMAGDRVLQVVAQRLRQYALAGVELARWGGDEFVVALPALRNMDQAVDLAGLFSKCLSDPIQIETGVVRIDATIGIAIFPDHGRTEEDLIRAADVAMYAGKEERRSKIRFFDPPLGRRLMERHVLERALRDAVDAETLSVVFQPIVSATSGACEILEALVRWDHPQRGPIPPSEFIPLAERTGEITALGRWVLLHACRQAASWPGSPPPLVSVNVSAVQIEAGTVAIDVANALGESGLLPSRLQLELTESAFAGDRRNVIHDLTRLREKGLKISLDDFGTGFSCLADLRRLPIDQIKIDKSFVESLDVDAVPIVKVIMTTARTLGLKVVAEGVETQVQAERLIELGTDYLQGYLFSKPLSPEVVREWLLVRHTAAAQDYFRETYRSNSTPSVSASGYGD
jgi:diguanylate cyclase (GGDEF)-like protein